MEWFDKIKNKLQFFSLGLMSGLIIGGGFFIFKLDDYFKELRAYKNIVQEQQNKEKEQPGEVEKTSEVKKTRTYLKKNNDSPNIDANNDSLLLPDKDLIANKKIGVDSSVNTIIRDSALTPNNDNENLIVRKDELVASKMVETQNLNYIANNNSNNKKDSIFQKLSGVKEDPPKTAYKVEIWTSPLNYKGYKMTKSKIILYGIVNYETIKLYQLGDDLYIKTLLNTYRIEYSSEFKPLEKITDESVLAKLR